MFAYKSVNQIQCFSCSFNIKSWQDLVFSGQTPSSPEDGKICGKFLLTSECDIVEASKTNIIWSVAHQVKLSFMFPTAAAVAVVYKRNKMFKNPSVVTGTILSYYYSV